ncbi:MAG: TIGR02206 family membrane protein [Saprospiraceae bacterium]|nr:TIGR02206 family membrane protein [Saprospiraceae bacterium]
MDPSWEQFLGQVSGFERFSIEHWIPMILWIFGTYQWINWAQKKSVAEKHRSAFWFSASLAFAVLTWMLIRMAMGRFDIKEDLPFHLCNILAVLFPVALYFQIKWFFGILYFWVLVGTLQAVITPDLREPFPHFVYFRYWWIHCGLITLIVYGLIVLKWRIEVRDIGNAIIGANVYLVFSLIINWFTGGNYFFTMRKPEAATLLDYLGPWPWYLLTGQLVMLIFFIIYYLPVRYFQNRKEQKA